VNWSDVFAGEICMTPAPVIRSMTVRLTVEDAAPTTTLTPACSSRSAVWVAVSVDAVPLLV
jgi:hypothetical protein